MSNKTIVRSIRLTPEDKELIEKHFGSVQIFIDEMLESLPDRLEEKIEILKNVLKVIKD